MPIRPGISESLPKHDPEAFKVGDKVNVVKKVTAAEGWNTIWNGGMDRCLGAEGVVAEVRNTIGFYLQFPQFPDTQSWCFPSCALELVKPKPKRVRVKDGLWDKAPCTHLRWHLMAVLREKLVLLKSPMTEGRAVAEIEVGCKKCNVSMKLRANDLPG